MTPDALSRLAFWETNVNQYAVADLSIWEGSEDHRALLRKTFARAAGCRRVYPLPVQRIEIMCISAITGFVEELLRRAEDGDLGDVDMQRVSAIGFSSGAYMTSRMAVNYGHRFRSFVVNGGSYYYCSGGCNDNVANDVAPHIWELHGPTLFLANSNDGTGARSAAPAPESRLSAASYLISHLHCSYFASG